MTDHTRLLQIAHEAVDHAKPLFLEGTSDELTSKGDRDYATETDYQIERELRDRLAKLTPDIGFLGEEDGRTGPEQRWWCLDPIDGTVNYVHGNPLCGISLALVEEDEPVIGVIDLPRLDNRYWASGDAEAYRDGAPIRASVVGQLDAAIVSFGDFAVGEDAAGKNAVRSEVFGRLVEKALRVRMVGSAAIDLAWVAEGGLDAAVIIGSHIWDLAAGTTIVRQAGAQVINTSIGQSPIAIAAGSQLIDQIIFCNPMLGMKSPVVPPTGT